MKKLTGQFLILTFFFLSCNSTKKCPENINILPMYGNEAKCQEQLEIDKEFISKCIAEFKSRQAASKYYVDQGWKYFHKEDYETSMKRFNQAWLLDSTNADVYWGLGNLLGTQKEFNKSITLLEKSIKLSPKNPTVYENLALSYGQLFVETNDKLLLDKSIENLKTVIQLEPENARALGQLTAAYSYYTQKDSARKYLDLTDKFNPKAINPEVRKILSER